MSSLLLRRQSTSGDDCASIHGGRGMSAMDNLAIIAVPHRPAAEEIIDGNTQLQPVPHHRRPGYSDETDERRLLERLGLRLLVGQSPAFLSVVQQIPKISRYDATVLLLGETG